MYSFKHYTVAKVFFLLSFTKIKTEFLCKINNNESTSHVMNYCTVISIYIGYRLVVDPDVNNHTMLVFIWNLL